MYCFNRTEKNKCPRKALKYKQTGENVGRLCKDRVRAEKANWPKSCRAKEEEGLCLLCFNERNKEN